MIDQSDLDDIRAEVLLYLPESVTIARTNQTTTCRLAPERRTMTLDGLPSFIRLRRWLITLPNGTDVRVGDSLAIAGDGTYIALEISNPRSYSPSVLVTGVCPAQAFTGQTVTFQRPNSDWPPITVNVNIYAAWHDAKLVAYAADYDWAVVWYTPDAMFTVNDRVAVNDQIVWPELSSTGAIATLERPRRSYAPVPYTCAYIREFNGQ